MFYERVGVVLLLYMFSIGKIGRIILRQCAWASLCPKHAYEGACMWVIGEVRFGKEVVVVLGWGPRVLPPAPRVLPAVSC